MATQIVSEKLLRWKGDADAIKELSIKAEQYIEEKTGSRPTTVVRTTFKKVDTLFDSMDEFEMATRDDFPKLQKISLTVGQFDRDADLSAEIVLSKAPIDPGAAVKARGHDDAYVEWLGKTLLQLLKRGGRRLPLTATHIAFIILGLFLVGQYFFYQVVNIPPLSELAYYLFLIAASFLPLALMYLGLWAVNWTIPQLELLRHRDSKTRWQSYHKRGLLAIGAITTAIIAPILVSLIQKQMGLS